MRWLDSITDSMDLSKLWEIVEDRESRCTTVHVVAKSRTWLSNWTTTLNYCIIDRSSVFLYSVLKYLTWLIYYKKFGNHQHREICSKFNNKLNGKRFFLKIDKCICISVSISCTPKTNTLLIYYAPIYNKNS